jgi:hypothetical protein
MNASGILSLRWPSSLLLALFLVCSSPEVRSQPFVDLVTFHSLIGRGSMGSGDESAKVASQYELISLQAPVRLREKPQGMLLLAPYTDRWTTVAGDSSLALRGYGLPVNLLWKLDSSRWDLLSAVFLRWNAFDNRLDGPLQYGLALLAGRRYSDCLRLRYGIYANREYFGWWILPLLGVDWKWKNGDRIFGILPGSLTYEHRLSRRWFIGCSYRAYTTSYALPADRYFRMNETQGGAYVDFYPVSFLALNLEAGHSILRHFRSGEIDRKGEEVTAKDGGYLRFGLSFRKRLD